MRRETKDRITVSRSRNLALAAVFGALYAALVIGFAPISNLPIQVRIADVLMPLAILFGWPVILGLGIGTVVGNFAADSITGFPSASIGLDMVGGSLVNLLAGFLAWKIGQRSWRIGNWNRFIATLLLAALISVVVGSYLSFVVSLPVDLSILGILAGEIVAINIGRIRNWNNSWFIATLVETALISVVVGGYLSVVFPQLLVLSILGILVGEVLAINIGGFALLNIIGKPRRLDLFRSWGLQIYGTDHEK
jgi:uncharacterized membrane protein